MPESFSELRTTAEVESGSAMNCLQEQALDLIRWEPLSRPAIASKVRESLMHFEGLDSNKNGLLERDEVDNAITNGGAGVELVVLSKTNGYFIQQLCEDSPKSLFPEISMQDFNSLANLLDSKTTNSELDPTVKTCQRLVNLKEIDSQDLFKEFDKLPSIRFDVPQQGTIGDCFLISAMSAIANCNPSVIEQIISPNSDGSYTVTFPGDPQHPVRISAPTEAERALFASGGEHGIWPLVIEKAFGQWRGGNSPMSARSPFGYLDGGGNPAETLRMLTGKAADSYILSSCTLSDVHTVLTEGRAQGSPMVAGTDGGTRAANAGLVTNHAYTVVDYDPDSRLVTLRNPYGHGDGTQIPDGKNDGVFSMTVDEFCATFSVLSLVVDKVNNLPPKVPSFG